MHISKVWNCFVKFLPFHMPVQFMEAIHKYFQIFIEGFKSFKDETVICLQPGLNIVGMQIINCLYFVADNQHNIFLFPVGHSGTGKSNFLQGICSACHWCYYLSHYMFNLNSSLNFHSNSVCPVPPPASLSKKAFWNSPFFSWSLCQVCPCWNHSWQQGQNSSCNI